MHLSSLLVLSLASVGLAFNEAALDFFQRKEQRRDERMDRMAAIREPSPPVKRSLETRQSSSPFLNNMTQQFVVNGSALPEVDFDIGESYAGLLPISDNANETRKLYFWFFPSSNPDASEEITIWLNGGPGCSSLLGLFTENGPVLWQAGTLAPTQNSYSWVNLTNMLYIEQPVGVGYSEGTPDITNEVELGEQFLGFYKQFVDTFQTKGYKTYITGESYGGVYVPYIADAFIGADDIDYYNLAGIAINDPLIGDQTIQEQVVILPFVKYWKDLFYLNDTFMEELQQRQDFCNFSSYYDTYFKYPPPPSPWPVLPNPYNNENYTCDMFDDILDAAILVNPCFDLYHITATCPTEAGYLGIVNPGDYEAPGSQVYFNRTDVKKVINAPLDSNWMQCTDKNVFNNGYVNNYTTGDASDGPATNGVLQRVIEYTNNTIIGSGNLDMILTTNGTLMAIQNMTWNGMQGFQVDPQTQDYFYVPYHPEYNGGRLAGAGYVGRHYQERGLTFYTVQLAGHEVPGYAAGAGYRMLEKLLGRIQSLGQVSDFTTQTGNFTGNSTLYRRDSDADMMAWL